MDMQTLANKLATRHHVSPTYATESVEDIIGQIERVGDCTIDQDDISSDDAEFVEGAFGASLVNDDNGRNDLTDELIHVSAQLRDLQAEADELADTRNTLVRELWEHGQTVRAIVDASGLNQSRVYAILNTDQEA